MDRLESMQAFVAAVEAGSLSLAARRRRVPLPTLSRRVAELEAHLGAQLLSRTRLGVALTVRGQAYFTACSAILDSIAEAERAAVGEYATPRGMLTITAPAAFGRAHIAPIVLAFLQAFPEVDVRLVLSDSLLAFDEEHVDLAIRVGRLTDSTLIATRLGSVHTLLCASPAYLEQHGAPRTAKDLASHACVNFEALSAAGEWRFGRNQIVKTRARFSVTTAEAAVDAALAGAGITQLYSYQVAEHLRSNALKLVLADLAGPDVPVHAVRRNARPPLKLRAFVDYMSPRLKAALDPA